MRCPDCGKFVSMENGEPEFNSCEASLQSGDVHVDVDVRVTRNCADCGTELKSLDLQLEGDFPLSEFEGFKELSDEDKQALLDSADAEMETIEVEADEDGGSMDESGGGRYKKNEITTTLDVSLTVKWERGPDDEVTLTKGVNLESKNAASEFEECC